jgi:hypothetical protein
MGNRRSETTHKLIWNRPLATAAVLLLLPSLSAACSLAACGDDADEMRPSFQIIVTHGHKPLAGVEFHILAKGVEQFSGVTNEMGVVRFVNLSPGLYWLDGDMLQTGVIYTCFRVLEKWSRKAKTKLTYSWGDEATTTHQIIGRLVTSEPGKGGTPIWNLTHSVDVPIAGAGLSLHDAISHAVYKTTSDQDGRFLFEGLPNGTYVLHIEGGNAAEFTYSPANEILKIDNLAKRNELVFRGSPNGCGDGNHLELQIGN